MAMTHRGLLPKQFDRKIIDMIYDRLSTQYSEYSGIAKEMEMPKGREYRAAEVAGLRDLEVIPEGGRPTFDVPVEGNEKAVEVVKYGLGMVVTEEMVADDYHDKALQAAAMLGEAAVDWVNKLYFDLFNNGNDTHTSWDGQYIYSASHTVLKTGATFSNLDSTALSETAFQAAFEHYDNLPSSTGRKTDIEGDQLLVPTKLRWMANRLLKQAGGISATGSNAVNMGLNDMTTNPGNGYVNGWTLHVLKYLTSETNWFFLSKKYQDNRLLWKKRITVDSFDDPHTDSRMYKVTLRTVPATFDAKGSYGSFV